VDVKNSVAEPHHFGGAGAVTRCGSGGSGSILNVNQRWIIKKMSKTVTVSYFPINIYNHFNHSKFRGKITPAYRLTFVCFQKVGLLYSRVGAGAAKKFSSEAAAA
jgi:hypothetical protein